MPPPISSIHPNSCCRCTCPVDTLTNRFCTNCPSRRSRGKQDFRSVVSSSLLPSRCNRQEDREINEQEWLLAPDSPRGKKTEVQITCTFVVWLCAKATCTKNSRTLPPSLWPKYTYKYISRTKMCIVFQLKKHCPFFSNLILISLACILVILSLWLFVPFLGVSLGAGLAYCAYVFFILCIRVSSSPGSFQSKQKCFRGCFLLMMRVAPKAWGMSLSLDRQNS